MLSRTRVKGVTVDNETEEYRDTAARLNRPRRALPPRRPGSVRRTSSHQSIWSLDDESTVRIVGRARDLYTTSDGQPTLPGEDAIEAQVAPGGEIAALTGTAPSGQLARFVGKGVGGPARKTLANEMPEEEAAETRLFRLVDDLAGAFFMSVAGWYAWEGGIDQMAARSKTPPRATRRVEGVCLSYVQGSLAMTDDGRSRDERADHPFSAPILPADDPFAFHPIVVTDAPNEWRLRQTDIWREGDEFVVDAWFQDSAGVQNDANRRLIFHEYAIAARFEAATLDLTDIAVTPHVLPYVTCHAAPATAQVLVGRRARDLRRMVLAELRGTAGCTHLNDMLRALQDVSGLAAMLEQSEPADRRAIAPGSTAD